MVNVYITDGKITIFHGNIHELNGDFPISYVKLEGKTISNQDFSQPILENPKSTDLFTTTLVGTWGPPQHGLHSEIPGIQSSRVGGFKHQQLEQKMMDVPAMFDCRNTGILEDTSH